MISEKMINLGKKRSVISEINEYGKNRAAEIGTENVFNFSLGNPNVSAPNCIREAILDLLERENTASIHGYTSVQGDSFVRKDIADYINNKFKTDLTANNIFMTAGATASLNICINALALPEDEFITFTPYFPEYRIFVEAVGGKFIPIPTNEHNFQINFEKFNNTITKRTKAVIVNSPNNPSGMVLSKNSIQIISKILNDKSVEYGHPIYLISDDSYRDIVYDGIEVPYLPNYYDNTLICYSFSKSLSLSGERIGYIAISDKINNLSEVYAAVCGASRILGYVCAPSLFQHVVATCINHTPDISIYKNNRDILYEGLTKVGFHCIKPDGAFYFFVKAMESSAFNFCEKAKKYELLLVPGDDFGCPGYVRIAYCVTTEQIIKSLPSFENLAREYSNK